MARIHKNKSGYKVFSNSGKLVHRHVAERKIGGKIFDGYEVHHKDGNKLNNKRSNLAVMKKRNHRGLHARKRRNSIIY